MSLDFLKTEYEVLGAVINDMVPKVSTSPLGFGIVVNDMVPKVIVDLINFHWCFGIVVNDMVPKGVQHQSI